MSLSSGGRRWSPFERHVPIVYLVAALVLLAVVVPSALRLPQQPPPSSGAFAPDEPPDPEVLITELNRARSTTAGAGVAVTGTGNEGPGDEFAGLATAAPVPRACPFPGYGSPPRQTFSLYSTPCAPPCPPATEATWQGATPSEVKVAVGWPAGEVGTAGPVAGQRRDGMSEGDRTLTDIQMWLNSRYDFCGRRMQLHVVNGGDSAANYGSIAARIDQEIGAFAAVYGRYQLMAELARRGVVSFGEQLDQFSESYYRAHHPYIWNWTASTTVLLDMSAEYVCKRLLGRTARFGGPDVAATQRKFGIVFNVRSRSDAVDEEFARPFASRCGGAVPVRVAFGQGGETGPTASATAIARLRNEGVTTVVTALGFVDVALLTHQASTAGYTPEWFVTGVGNVDFPVQARAFMNQAQWAHAFGISALELEWSQNAAEGNVDDSDCYAAVHEVDPDFSASRTTCNIFPSLLQVANGVQAAGPVLNPQTFARGLAKPGVRLADPVWSIGGGYAAARHAYPTYAGEIWYDPTALNSNGVAGNYRWTRAGRKYASGEWDADGSELFRTGVATRGDANRANGS